MSWQDDRPMSPHLQIYDLPLTAKMSIIFRIAGAALFFVMLLVVAALGALAAGADAWAMPRGFFSDIEGRVFLFLVTLVFYYHLCNGVRHLVWDTVHGLEKSSLGISGAVVLGATFVLTLSTWWLAR